MTLCGFRIYRGDWFFGPCRRDEGHDRDHSPYAPGELEREFKERFGFSPFQYIDLSDTRHPLGDPATPIVPSERSEDAID